MKCTNHKHTNLQLVLLHITVYIANYSSKCQKDNNAKNDKSWLEEVLKI